jgi:DNA polymerase-3 subunit gamma/tau
VPAAVRAAAPAGGRAVSDPVAARPAPPPSGKVAAADRWTALVADLAAAGSISALVRELALQAECVSFDETSTPSAWCLRVERESLRAPALVDKLQAAVAAATGRETKLVVEAGATGDTPARRDAAEQARRLAEAEQIIRDDPLVRTLLAQYRGARIVPGSIKPH